MTTQPTVPQPLPLWQNFDRAILSLKCLLYSFTLDKDLISGNICRKIALTFAVTWRQVFRFVVVFVVIFWSCLVCVWFWLLWVDWYDCSGNQKDWWSLTSYFVVKVFKYFCRYDRSAIHPRYNSSHFWVWYETIQSTQFNLTPVANLINILCS